MLSEVFFQSPWHAFFLLLLPVMVLMIFALYSYRKRMLRQFADPSQHPYLVGGISYRQRDGRYVLLLFSYAMAVVALMQPAGNAHYPASLLEENEKLIKAMESKPWHEVMFVIDTSQSMAVTDTRQRVSRLDLSKEIAQAVLIDLKGKMVSLAAFTSVETPLVPATQDLLFTLLMLRQVGLNEGDVTGTDIAAALEGVNQHFKEDTIQKVKSVILFTDGGDTAIDEPGRLEKILHALGDPFAMNLRLFAIGMGSETGGTVPEVTYQGSEVHSALNKPLLEKIAAYGRGKVILTDGLSSQSIATLIRAAVDAQESPEEIQEVIRHSRGAFPDPIYSAYFRFPLALSVLALILFLWMPQRRYAPLALFFLSCATHGFAEVEDPLIYLEAGQGVRAEQMYHELLTGDKDSWHQAVERYNLGCFSLERGDYDGALGYFNEASSIENLSPLLISYLRLNTSIATILLAEKMVQNKEIQADQGLILLRDAQESLKEGYEADCGVAKIEGSDVCAEKATYSQVNLYLQRLAAAFRKQAEIVRKNKKSSENTLPPPQKHLQSVLDATLSMLTRQQMSETNMDFLLHELEMTQKLFPQIQFKEAVDQTVAAQKALHDQHPEETRFFLRSLYQFLEMILVDNKRIDPQSALEAAIEEEMNAIDMVLEFNKMTEVDVKNTLKTILLQKQERTLEAGNYFITKVFEQEKKEFQENGFCQKEPWHHALPLYFEGYKMALAAEGELQKGSLIAAVQYQNETLDYWRLALKALKTPPPPSSSSKNRQEQQVVQTLVEMDAEDRPKKPLQTPKVVEKPW